VGRKDNFFMLGGHSLLAVQMIDRLRRIGRSISVRALFETPTLCVLAQSLSQHQAVVVPSNLIMPHTERITPDLLPLIDLTQDDIDHVVNRVAGGTVNVQDIYALSPLQDGILFHHIMADKGDPYLTIIQMAFDDRAVLDRYLDAVQRAVDRHDILRTAVVWENIATPAQVVLRQATLSVTEHALAPADGLVAEQLMHLCDPRINRIDLTQAPLTRFVIAQDTDGRWIVVQLLHHLIGDHSTLEVMNDEIQAVLQGRGAELAPPQPFRNLIAQARLGVSIEDHERYFSKMLKDIDTAALPYGLSDVHQNGLDVVESHMVLPQSLNDRLRSHSKRLGVSLASLCHLAWAQVIARTSGQQHVVFGTVLFGRMDAGSGSSRAMGLFINTLPLRVDVDDTGVKASVRQVQTDLASLLEHEHASLALAQRCSGVSAGTPLFSAMLNYRHQSTTADQASGDFGMEIIDAQERTNYPFVMSVDDFGSALALSAQILQPIDAAQVCRYMQQTLVSMADALEHSPQMPAHQLKVLPAED
ncbi:hypothetical protein BGZ54_004692, partial [Gamsiella multidivaricata]